MSFYRPAAALIAAGFVLVSACSSGGNGPAPPAFTNLAGTRWSVTETVSALNSCNVGIGVSDMWTAHILAQSGNTISVYDERSSPSSAGNCSISGYVITCMSSHYPQAGCSSLSASYDVTLSTDGSSFSGTATIACNDNGCSVPVNVMGMKRGG